VRSTRLWRSVGYLAQGVSNRLHPAEQARGRAMIEAAATDFRSLEMVTYANLAEQFLRQ
jgi:hypothetical protein